MDKWMTKRNILLASIIGSLFLGFTIFFWEECYDSLSCRESLYFSFFSKADWLIFFPTLFVLSLAYWKINDVFFKSWLHFAYWWIPLSFLIIFATPTSNHAWALSGPNRETTTWILDGLFLLISLILIAYKSYRLKGK